MRARKGIETGGHTDVWFDARAPRLLSKPGSRVYGAMASNAVGSALACVMGLPPETSNPKSTLLRELYSLTTSPSGRARPLGEVAKEYNSLRRVTGSKPRAPETVSKGSGFFYIQLPRLTISNLKKWVPKKKAGSLPVAVGSGSWAQSGLEGLVCLLGLQLCFPVSVNVKYASG